MMNILNNKKNLSIIFSVIVAGAIIFFAWYFSQPNSIITKEKNKPSKKNIKAVNSTDYLMGNPLAPIKLVEFSDPECAFCKKFHPIMTKIMEGELGKSGQVAWVYRHFFPRSGESARIKAEAVECAGELGGNDKFWDYLDRLFFITPNNNLLDLGELPNIAKFVNLDINKFNNCLAKKKYQAKIEAQHQDGINSGALGTPWNIIIDERNGEKFVIGGTYDYRRVKATLQAILENKMPK